METLLQKVHCPCASHAWTTYHPLTMLNIDKQWILIVRTLDSSALPLDPDNDTID